ncbi:unnamed protein product [Ranitomeya imitator]|uniref:Uncharacterized protein n=1 Tax=Ranitomeya imitator TaxID=111125 RepID=A0ABN9LLL3_9NEOB|nr:unnamed protein product [Ranitomeya imitator]
MMFPPPCFTVGNELRKEENLKEEVTVRHLLGVNLIDFFCGGWALLFAAVLELVAVIWIYGGNRVILDIEMMIGKKHWIFWLWWRICWYFVSPVL